MLPVVVLASSWFPLELGNVWTFDDPARTEVAVEASWGPVHYVEGLSVDGNWLLDLSWFGGPDDVFIWNDTSGRWDVFVPAEPNHRPWRVDLSGFACDTYELALRLTRETYDTPAGRFHDARTYDWKLIPEPNVRCRAPALREVVLGIDAGPILFTDGASHTARLAEAHVGARVFGPQPSVVVYDGDLATRAQLDANLYVNEHNTIYCVRAPCPSNQNNAALLVDVTLRNDSDERVVLGMPTGQWFDARVVDEDGRSVRVWSEDQVFTQATQQIVLAPGEVRVGAARIELVDREGFQLEGRFTAEAWVLGLDATAAVEFDVDVVPSVTEPKHHAR